MLWTTRFTIAWIRQASCRPHDGRAIVLPCLYRTGIKGGLSLQSENMFVSSHFVGQTHLRLVLLSAWPGIVKDIGL